MWTPPQPCCDSLFSWRVTGVHDGRWRIEGPCTLTSACMAANTGKSARSPALREVTGFMYVVFSYFSKLSV